MKENEKYQKLDLAAMLEDVQKGHPRLKNTAIRQYANFFEIFTNEYSLDTDDVISISLMLFGVHNSLRIGMVSGMDDEGMKGVILQGSVYYVLPKYYVKGETVIAKSRFLKTITGKDE